MISDLPQESTPPPAHVRLAEAIADAPPPLVKEAIHPQGPAADAPAPPPTLEQITEAIRQTVKAELASANARAHSAATNTKATKGSCADGCECPRGACTCDPCPIKEATKPKTPTVGRFDGTFYYLKDATGQEWYGGDWAQLWTFVWRIDHPVSAQTSRPPVVRYTVSNGVVYRSTCASGSCSAPVRVGPYQWPR
jgi:hypothetical protein